MDAIGRLNKLNNKGVAVVLLALMMVALVAFVGLAVDVGYVYVAKGQLQNAADAGALAGAGALYPNNSSPPPVVMPNPDFTTATTSAKFFTKQNKVAGANLTDSDIVSVQAGYWDLSRDKETATILPLNTSQTGKCSSSGKMCTAATATTDCSSTEECNIQIVPAVQVTVQKSSLPTFFAKIVGFNSWSPVATAVAVRGFALSTNKAFPVAVTKCMVDNYFNKIPFPNPPPDIYFTTPYPSAGPNCTDGQWTSLTLGTSNVPDIRDLMDGTKSSAVNFGTDIFIDPGVKDTVYQKVEAEFIGKTVILPVVADPTATPKQWDKIVAFVAFTIGGVKGSGSSTQLFGKFSAYYTDPNAGRPGGSQSNLITPPILVK